MSRPLEELPPHGTRARYYHPRSPCRSSCCRAANADYAAAWRARQRCGCTVRHVDPMCTVHAPPLPLELEP